jgi:hypothetical protein
VARSYGRIFATIWNDGDFRPLSVTAKLMYSFLISQTDLEHSGIIPLRPPRWARDLGLPVEDVIAALKELDQARFTVTDEEWGELLVRSLIRRDDIWKQPNVFKSAAASAKASKSTAVKSVLLLEVRRLDLTGIGRETRAIRDDLLAHLEPFGNPSPNPPEGFPNPSGGPGEGHAKGSANPRRDEPGIPSVSAGQNPSATLREVPANHSAGPTGKGEGYGPVLGVPIPLVPSPLPVAAPEPVRQLWPFAVPDALPEEGDQSGGDQTPEQLASAIRRLRPEWSTRSIERALAEPSVAERPWPMVCVAAVAVARDPESKHPGRLSHDGPWWISAARPRQASLPPVDRHAYESGPADTGCTSCGLPESNRRHLESA